MPSSENDAWRFPPGSLAYAIADRLNLPWVIVEAIVEVVVEQGWKSHGQVDSWVHEYLGLDAS